MDKRSQGLLHAILDKELCEHNLNLPQPAPLRPILELSDHRAEDNSRFSADLDKLQQKLAELDRKIEKTSLESANLAEEPSSNITRVSNILNTQSGKKAAREEQEEGTITRLKRKYMSDDEVPELRQSRGRHGQPPEQPRQSIAQRSKSLSKQSRHKDDLLSKGDSRRLQEQIRRQQKELDDSVKSASRRGSAEKKPKSKGRPGSPREKGDLKQSNMQLKKRVLELEIRAKRLQEQNERLKRKERRYREQAERGAQAVEQLQRMMANFEKSEQIRKKQKSLIAKLKEENAFLKQGHI